MAELYANENFPLAAVLDLRALGHDVLTSVEAGTANQSIPDEQVLRYAAQHGRAVLTHNRKDFKRLHQKYPDHCGIIVCTEDTNFRALAKRIDRRIRENQPLGSKLIKVTRSNPE